MKTAIVAVPRLEPHRPPPGPAIVAKLCSNLGHDVTAYDLNIKLYRYCQHIGQNYHDYDGVFDTLAEPTTQQLQFLEEFIKHWCDIICQDDYDYIMVSVFGMSATWFAEKFLTQIRPMTDAKIIIGGMGVGTTSLIDETVSFGEKMRSRNLVNDFIVGEAEYNLVKCLNGESGPGINNSQFHQIDDIENLPLPDYGVFDLDEYDYLLTDRREVYITGSRGCVRKCTYCDVERYWPKYRYRSGQSIANEIIDNYERFGVTRFYFTDSLVNGSLKVFSDFTDKLASYNFKEPINWSGQFIFRSQKTIPRDHFATMAASGAEILYVGIETGSDRVRKEMGKNFTNEDIEFQLAECSRNNIKVMPLMFTGYITETLEDHKENLKFFKRWQKYVADGTIAGVELGSNLIILPGAPVSKMLDEHQIRFLLDKNQDPMAALWYSESNPDLTLREQIRRKIEVHESAIQYKWPVWRQKSRLQELQQYIIQNKLWEDQSVFYKIVGDQGHPKTVIPIKVQS